MSNLFHNFRILALAVGALLGGTVAAEAAGLVGYRNDTNQAVIVQSTVTSNGRTSVSKPQTLYPGEVALDNLAFVGTRKITVYDAKNTKVVLYQGEVTNSDDAFYSIAGKTVTQPVKGGTKEPAAPPKLEIVKVQAPTMPKPGKPTTPNSQPPATNPPTKKKP